MGILSLLGFGERERKVLSYLANGAQIIDIRMPEEFAEDNLSSSVNIGQDDLSRKLAEIEGFGKPVLVCCSTGLRSDEAAVMLKRKGIDAINAGSYDRLKKIMDDN